MRMAQLLAFAAWSISQCTGATCWHLISKVLATYTRFRCWLHSTVVPVHSAFGSTISDFLYVYMKHSTSPRSCWKCGPVAV